MLTALQKLKILQNFICLIAVNHVYKSGVQMNKEGKEKQSFIVFEAELSLYNEKRGRWASISEYPLGEFTMTQIRAATKNSNLTSEKIWEKGMAARRDLVSWIADYWKILNFTLIKPIVNECEIANKEHFDLELTEDSGGNADLELLKILKQVLSTAVK